MPHPDFRRIFDETPAPLLLLTPDFVIVHANRARLQATATTLEATVGRGLFEVFPMNPADPAADGLVNLRDSLAQARDTRRPVTMAIQKYDIPLPDGTWAERYWSPRNVPILDEDGQVVWLLHRSDDITDYVRTRDQARATSEQNQLLREHAAQVEADLFARTRELEQLVADLARATASAERSAERAEDSARAERAAAARTAEITESMAVGYLAMDASWAVTYANARAVAALGLSREDLVGAVIWELFPATVGTDFEAGYRRAATTGEVVTFDAYYPAPLDAWFEVRATPEAGGVALYFIDITDRHHAQQAAQAAAAQISGLAEVALAMVDLDDVTDLVTVIAEQGLAALGADGGAVAVQDLDDPGVLLSYVTASYGRGARAEYARLPLEAALPVCEAARTGTPVLVGDRGACLAYSPAMAEVVASTGSQAFASLPMRADDRVIAVVTAGWDSPQTFSPAQVELLEAFAAQCAQALQRLQSRDAERRAADRARTSAARQTALVTIARALAEAQTRTEVLDVVNAHGITLLGAAGAGLALTDPTGAHVEILTVGAFSAEVQAQIAHLPADTPLPIVRAAIDDTTYFLPDRAAAEALFPGCEALYAAADTEASAEVPLRAGGRVLGTLSTAFTGPRVWTGEERDLMEAFAALTAQALSRITAHDAEQAALAAASGIAETLQRSMLTAPPEPDHLQIAVRYAAAADHAEVGGDWYDAFITSEGLTSLVIGDVTGHDMRAASVMGQLRNLVRGIGYTLGQPPAAVLAAVDRAAAGLGIDTVATAIVAQVKQTPAHRAAGTRLLRWSNAGHLPPLLIAADGAARFLEGESDLVLGWEPNVDRHDHEVVLAPGSTVLLYTDGLVERRRAHLEHGLAWLAKAAGELASSPEGTLEELCDGLIALVGDHLDDDVALLALRAHPEDAPRPVEAGPERVPAGLEEARAAAQDAE